MTKKIDILLWKNKIWESRVSNTGDLAIIRNTILKIKQAIPEARLHMFSDDPEYIRRHHGIFAHSIRMLLHPVELLRLMKRMDLILLGGGTIIQDNYFIGVIPINLSLGLVGKLLKKKVVCNAIGVGAEEEISAIGKWLAVFSLKRFDSITVRDMESKYLLDKWLGKSDSAVVTNDIAVDLPEADFSTLRGSLEAEGVFLEKTPTVAIAARKIFHHEKTPYYILPSSLRAKLNLMHPLYKKRVDEFITCLADFCDYIIKKYNVNVLFVPFYSTGGGLDSQNRKTPRRFFASGDNMFAETVRQRIRKKDHAKILQRSYTPEEIIAIIGKCEALIGVPYHSVIFASARNVPLIGINYVSKVERYMKILGMADYLLPAKIRDGVDPHLLREKFDRLWASREEIRIALEKKNEVLTKMNDLNISVLKETISQDNKAIGSFQLL